MNSLFTHRKNEPLVLGQAGTVFKAPMRGAGVMRRGHMQRGGRGGRAGRDHFRDRAQNTSRPPSMHVDDFVKMAANPSTDSPQEGRVSNQRLQSITQSLLIVLENLVLYDTCIFLLIR